MADGVWCYGKRPGGTWRYQFRQPRCIFHDIGQPEWNLVTWSRMHASDPRTIDVEDGSADAVMIILGLSAHFRETALKAAVIEAAALLLPRGPL